MKKSVKGSLLIIALFLAALNLRLAINSVSPILETIQEDLAMSASKASLLTTIPVFCMGLFSPLAAKLGTRWGLERIITWSLALIGIGTILRLYAHTTITLIFTAFIAGLGIAIVGPLLSGYIKLHFPSKVPTMVAIYTLALTIGAALASGLSIPLLTWVNSWKGVLALWGVFGVIAGLVWLSVLRKVESHAVPSTTSEQGTARIPWRNRRAWLLTISFGLLAMLFYAVTAWLPPIILSMGYSKLYAGNILTIFAVVQIPAGLLMRMLLERFPSRLLWLIIASVTELTGFIMIILSFPPWIAAIFIGLGAGTLFSLNLLLPIDMTNNPHEAASWAAMTQSVGYVIGATGPLILGWIHDITHSFSLSLIGMVVINVLMISVQIMMMPKRVEARLDVVGKDM